MIVDFHGDTALPVELGCLEPSCTERYSVLLRTGHDHTSRDISLHPGIRDFLHDIYKVPDVGDGSPPLGSIHDLGRQDSRCLAHAPTSKAYVAFRQTVACFTGGKLVPLKQPKSSSRRSTHLSADRSTLWVSAKHPQSMKTHRLSSLAARGWPTRILTFHYHRMCSPRKKSKRLYFTDLAAFPFGHIHPYGSKHQHWPAPIVGDCGEAGHQDVSLS